MFQLLYVSDAARPMSDQDLIDILGVSRRNNEKIDVSGILLYRDGRFMQVLEGDETVVRDLMKTIEKDERHRNVRILLQGDITDREFGDWAMGFPDIDRIASEDLDGVSTYMEGSFTVEELKAQQSQIQAMLKVFKGITT